MASETTPRRRKQRERPTQWEKGATSQNESTAENIEPLKKTSKREKNCTSGKVKSDFEPIRICQTASTEEEDDDDYDEALLYEQQINYDEEEQGYSTNNKLQQKPRVTNTTPTDVVSLSFFRDRLNYRRRRRRVHQQSPSIRLRYTNNYPLGSKIFPALLLILCFVILALLWIIYILLSTMSAGTNSLMHKGSGLKSRDDRRDIYEFGKPFKDLTYHDIPFEFTSRYWHSIPSCDDPIEFDEIEFTLVTQVSEDRLWMLTQHCQRWPGQISAAVYSDKQVDELYAMLKKESEFYNAPCRNNQIIFSTRSTNDNNHQHQHRAVISEEQAPYPVNTLRNLAFSKVTTTHFMYVDIDFWVSSSLYNILQTPSLKQALVDDPQLALVMPAFQMERNEECQRAQKQKRGWWWKKIPLPRSVRKFFFSSFNQAHLEEKCRTETVPMVPDSFESMVSKVLKHKATAFDPSNKGGHGSTSYKDWIHMEDGELKDIPCIQSNRYEPYVAARWCDAYPPYQEVFTGYGKNKMTQIMQMRQSGYVFRQVGGAFVCHYPHPPAKSRSTWIENGKKQHKLMMSDPLKFEETYGVSPTEYDWTQFPRGRVDKLFIEYRAWLDAAVPPYQSRTPICEERPRDDDAALWLNSQDRPAGWFEQNDDGGGGWEEVYYEYSNSGDLEEEQREDDDSSGDGESISKKESRR